MPPYPIYGPKAPAWVTQPRLTKADPKLVAGGSNRPPADPFHFVSAPLHGLAGYFTDAGPDRLFHDAGQALSPRGNVKTARRAVVAAEQAPATVGKKVASGFRALPAASPPYRTSAPPTKTKTTTRAKTVGPGLAHTGGGFSGDGTDTKPVNPPKSKPKGTPGRGPASVAPGGGGGGGGGGAPAVPLVARDPGGYKPMTPAQFANLAKSMANSELNPLIQVWQDAIKQANDQSASHDQAVSGFSTALGKILAPVGGQVSDMYGHAADAVAGYGQGFSSDNAQLKQDAGANASTANPNLTPDQQSEIAKSYAGTPYNVMYGLNGRDPATELRMAGTGIGAVLSKLPQVAGAYGQQWLAGAHDQAMKNLTDLQTKMAEARGQYPQLYNSALNNLMTQDQRQQSLDLTRRYELGNMTGYDPATGLPTARTTAAATAAGNAARKIDASNSKAYGVRMNAAGDVLVGKDGKPIAYPTGDPNGQKVNVGLSKVVGALVDSYGHPIHSKDGKIITLPDTKGQYHGMTQATFTTKHAQALGLARIAHKPHKDAKGNVTPAVSWQTYLDVALAKKIPAWVVIEAGKKVYSQAEIDQGLIPGVNGG